MSSAEKGFDRGAAEAGRDDGMGRVARGASPEWKRHALQAVRACALGRDTFIVDEVWKFMPPDVTTHELRAMGPVMRRAHAFGWIEPTTEFRPSDRISAHRNPRRVWTSCIRRG